MSKAVLDANGIRYHVSDAILLRVRDRIAAHQCDLCKRAGSFRLYADKVGTAGKPFSLGHDKLYIAYWACRCGMSFTVAEEIEPRDMSEEEMSGVLDGGATLFDVPSKPGETYPIVRTYS